MFESQGTLHTVTSACICYLTQPPALDPLFWHLNVRVELVIYKLYVNVHLASITAPDTYLAHYKKLHISLSLENIG